MARPSFLPIVLAAVALGATPAKALALELTPAVQTDAPDVLGREALGLFRVGLRQQALAAAAKLPLSQGAQVLKADLLLRAGMPDEALRALAPVEFDHGPQLRAWTRVTAMQACASHLAGRQLERDERLAELAQHAPRAFDRVEALACAGREVESEKVLAAVLQDPAERTAAVDRLRAEPGENLSLVEQMLEARFERLRRAPEAARLIRERASSLRTETAPLG